jgi:hypothetical protein
MVFPVQHTASIRRHALDLRAFDSVHVGRRPVLSWATKLSQK